MKRFLLSIIYVWAAVACFAQQVTVTAHIDSITILVGKQARLTVDVTAQHGARIEFPRLSKSQNIVPGVEVVDCSPVDTSDVDGLMLARKTFVLTSFDEKLYPIPGVSVKVNGKHYTSSPLALKVLTCDVDTLHPEKFYPPKDIQNNPFKWSELSPLFWLAMLAVLMFVACVYLYMRLKQNKPIITKVRIVRHIPPHQKALGEINLLKSESFDTADQQKDYYTHLTDTLRRYIRERFGFNAMEMTSSEIIQRLRECGDQAMIDELYDLFVTADLVKFAKYSSMLNEKDMNLVNAVNFINQTKREDAPTEERIVPKLSDDDKKKRNSRLVVKWLLRAIAAMIALIFIYIIYQLYQLYA